MFANPDVKAMTENLRSPGPAGEAVAEPVARLRLFGTTALTGAPGADALLAQPKRLALLAYLAIARPIGFHRRDRLVGLFWPEHDQEHARAALRKGIHAIRKELGENIFIARGDEEIAVNRDQLWCDATAFDEAVDSDRLAKALELFKGDLLDGFFADAPGFEEWLAEERQHFRDRAARAALTLAQRYETGADLTEATRWARRVARIATTDERVLRHVISLLDRAGDRAGAVRVYQEFADRLRTEYDVAPSPETQALIKRIRDA